VVVRLLSFVIFLLLACAPARAADAVHPDVVSALEKWSLPVPSTAVIIVCHGYGCLYRTEVGLSRADHAKFAQLLAGSPTPEAERKAIGHLEAWYEKRVAPHSGTAHAKARAGGGLNVGGDPSQFDCIDTTANTTALLIVLSKLGLLKHHTVSTPISRMLTGGGPHFTAVIQQKGTDRRYTVDPWPHDNGQYPDIMDVEKWLDGG
jgi:hypothetical protein